MPQAMMKISPFGKMTLHLISIAGARLFKLALLWTRAWGGVLCLGGAVYLAWSEIQGWGWFLLSGVILSLVSGRDIRKELTHGWR